MKTSTIVAGTVSWMFVPLLAAALCLFWGNFVFAGKARFKQLLSIMLYGEIIFAAGMLVLAPMMLAKGTMLVSLSPAVFATSLGVAHPLYVLLSKFSIFQIWEIVAIGIGLSILYDVTRKKGYVLSVLSMGMLSIIHVVWTAIAKAIF
jgi:hypothetical protein